MGSMVMKPKVVVPAFCGWIGTISTMIAADIILDKRRNGSTLSEAARWIFRTDTRLGKAVFVGSWAALSTWLIPHIINVPMLEELLEEYASTPELGQGVGLDPTHM